ncbi:MAG: hypothetical protein M5U26_05770 [Planctomycetota bacterium]|nr:hypothetical protein [Planctomycetota bacterium]
MSGTSKIQALVLIGCAAFAGWAGAEESTPAPAPSPDGSKATKPLQSQQQKVGTQLGKTSDQFGEVIEELKENLGVELESKEKVKTASEKLKSLQEQAIPKIVNDMKDGELRKALVNQGVVTTELTKLLKQMQKELAPAVSQKALKDAIKKQKSALTKAKETRLANENLEGKPRSQLTEEEKERAEGSRRRAEEGHRGTR